MNIPELIEKKKVDIAALRKRIVGIDAMMAQGQEERNALVADTIKEMGHLEGLQAALGAIQAAQEQKEDTKATEGKAAV